MLTFQRVGVHDLDTLRTYYRSCPYGLSDYSAGMLLMWEPLRAEYAEAEGCLIVKVHDGNDVFFHYPVPSAQGDEDAALTQIEGYCLKNGIALSFSVVPQEKVSHITRRYPFYRLRRIRSWQDYIYRSEDMRTFAGRHYSGQRNHINKFFRQYPTAHFRPLRTDDVSELEQFFNAYESAIPAEETGKVQELCYTRKLFRLLENPAFRAGCMEWEGRIIAVSLGEICGNTMIVHIEKALSQYEGIYPAMVREFAAAFGRDAAWFNREDDAAEKGLRISKLQYRPTHMGEKYRIDIENELSVFSDVSEIKTEHLLLRPIVESRTDATASLSIRFSVMRGDICIADASVDTFDFRGGAELHLRLLSEYAGRGLEREAFLALKDWALYDLGLRVVRASCRRDDSAQRELLNTCMRRSGEDEISCRFEAIV